MSTALSLFGIFFGLFLLIVLTYKGLHLSWVSILVAVLIMVTSGLAITDTWNNVITTGIANIAGTMIPIYVAGATFGMFVMYNLANSLFIPVLGLDVAFAHRAIGFAGAVLDTMPFGNMVVSLLLLTGIKQKDGYPPVGYATVGVTFLACVFVCILGLMGIR